MDNALTRDHWEPQPSERLYYRSASSGDLGYLVRREGKDRIRLDRPMQEIIRPFNEGEWVRDNEFKPYSRTQVTRLAFEVDKLMCALTGAHKEARADWLSLKDEEKARWMKEGTRAGGLRGEMYAAVMGVLSKVSR